MTIRAPGAGRIAVASIAVIAAAMTYPWHTGFERWVLAITAPLVIIVAGQWGGLYVTTILRRRLRLLLSGSGKGVMHRAVGQTGTDVVATVLTQVIDGPGSVPVELIAGYLDRFGIRAQSVRITSRDNAAGRVTWIGLTISAAANLPALQARSSAVPLRGVAEATVRRLADELRERGWVLSTSEVEVPDLLGAGATERWRSVADSAGGHLAAYSLSPDLLTPTLDELWSGQFGEMWTALEITAHGIAAACAIRTNETPAAAAPMSGMRLQRGIQGDALARLAPTSTISLVADVSPIEHLATIRWSATGGAHRRGLQEIRRGD